MKKNEQFVITINRELGSGGRTVGRLLAEKLGVPFYDKAVIKAPFVRICNSHAVSISICDATFPRSDLF